MNVQYTPSWSQVWTPKKAEEELNNFIFKGPGIYEIDGDSILVLPLKGDWLTPYDHEKTRFKFMIWNDVSFTQMLKYLIEAPIFKNK